MFRLSQSADKEIRVRKYQRSFSLSKIIWMKILINGKMLVCEILVYQRGKVHNSKSTVNPGGIYTLLKQRWCTFYPMYERSSGNEMTCSTGVRYLLYGAMDEHITPLCKETKWNILFLIDCLKFHRPLKKYGISNSVEKKKLKYRWLLQVFDSIGSSYKILQLPTID